MPCIHCSQLGRAKLIWQACPGDQLSSN